MFDYESKLNVYLTQYKTGNITDITCLDRIASLEKKSVKYKESTFKTRQLFVNARKQIHQPTTNSIIATKKRLDKLRKNKYPKLIKQLEEKYAKGEINAHQFVEKGKSYQSLLDMSIDKYYKRWLNLKGRKRRKKAKNKVKISNQM